MYKEQLRELLHQEYNSENWKKISEFVFPNVQYFQRPQSIPFSNDNVESFKQVGNVKLNDGKNLAMFEVRVAEKVNLARNRVELRKLVEKLIDQERNHGVLVIYEQGKEDYRFTFTAKNTEFDEEENDFVNQETDAKRFTYILGKNESCKTAANRFWELSTHKDTATIKDVENAFSVERLNKEFFNKYKAFYEDFVQYITGKRFVKEKGKWVEKKLSRAQPIHKEVFHSNDKLARNFVKLLLGRLVFIQFLQKKGWMGVPGASTEWKNGDPEFLLNFFKSAKNKEEFHSKCLYPLFYKAFNTPGRHNDVFTLTGTKVPYLNGGLFENENPRTKDIDFPASYFEDVLNFFGQYNFTIDENDPQDHEVGIDPEMLGHIFENLLEDNKDKGAFYTPKPIVQYMCQESLIQYLKTYLQDKQIWPQQEEASAQTETHLQNFVRKKIAGELLNIYDEHLARALKEVKICDPAIGSGAFPMGLLNEIFYCMQVLHHASPDTVGAVWEMEEWAPDLVKKNIIQNSIYGVDIEKGAVDIARLRFWLSLIVDEHEPTPLPNLDFKIMQGNSLLESYEGIDLNKIAGIKTVKTEVALDLFGNPINIQSSIFDTRIIDEKKISELIDNYFNTQEPEKKQRLKREIDSIIHNVLDECIKDSENKILIKITNIKDGLSHLKIDINHSTAVAAKTTKARVKLTKELENAQDELEHLKAKRKELHDLQKSAERPYFLWNLYFKDVIDKGGFDIVIGNPPYLNVESIDESIKSNISNFRTAYQKYDLYVLFFEKAIDITKFKGTLSFITSNKFLSQGYGLLLRQEFLEYQINTIINFNYDVFDAATVRTCILQLKKDNSIEENKIKIIDVESKNDKNKFLSLQYKTLKQTIFKNIEDNNFRINLTDEKISLLEKIKYNTIKVEDICSVNYGLRPSSEKLNLKKESFIHDSNPKGKFKEYFEGKDMGYWLVNETSFLDYKPKVMYNAMFPELFENEKLVGLRTLSDIGKLRFIYDRKGLYCNDSVVVLTLWNLLKDADFSTIIKNITEDNIQTSLDFDYKYLQAILNSKLIKFYVNELLYDGTHFYPNHMKSLPIKKIELKFQKQFIAIVKKIHDLESKVNGSNNNFYLRELDMMIFKLYDLSYNDLLIVEPNLSFTKEEYNNIVLEA